jgi:cytochrome c oxidase subunit IV
VATTQSHWDSEVPPADLDGAVKAYSKDKIYLMNFVVLFVITALEVATYFIEGLQGIALVGVLLVLAAIKFFLVAYLFMHLRFDKKILTWVFYSGLVLAVAVYIAVMTAFRIWWPADHMICDSAPQLKTNETLVQTNSPCPAVRT